MSVHTDHIYAHTRPEGVEVKGGCGGASGGEGYGGGA